MASLKSKFNMVNVATEYQFFQKFVKLSRKLMSIEVLFNFVDKIKNFKTKEYATGEKKITKSLYPYMIGNQLYPMMMIEAVGQLNAWITMEMHDFKVRPIAVLYGEIAIYDTAKLGDQLIVETELKRYDDDTSLFDGRVKLGDKVLIEVIDAAGSFLDINHFAFEQEYRSLFITLNQEELHDTIDMHLFTDHLFCYQDVKKTHDTMIAEKFISQKYPFFKEHFPKKPVLPISILLQNNLELCKGVLQNKNIYKIQLNKVKMRDFIEPNKILRTISEITINEKNSISFKIDNKVNEKTVCRGNINFYLS